MTPEDLAALHAKAFAPQRGWTADAFASLRASPHVALHIRTGGFALVRTVLEETELLTLAVDPDLRRRGLATALVQEWMTTTAARTAFLEVAEDNLAARALYHNLGFAVSGRRKAYYARPDGPGVDAVLMQAALPPRSWGK